ncbi:hypothetical protein [Micromonospora sp. NPDC005220]|uniref:hypothetical protein n=1 Tax=Micromonospora sp. NPDC005220 TaxID=3155589 RepID=UPI0033B18E26
MNVTDLKQVFDERSEDSAEHVVHHLRLHGVHAKVVARRRLRIATWTTCAVVALAGLAAAAVVPGLRRDVAPTPADGASPVRTIEGFPEYANGARVVAAKSTQLPERRIEVTIVPETLDLVVFNRCDSTDEKIALGMALTVNGHDLSEGSCSSAIRPSGWNARGVEVGRPATFVMTINGAQRSEETGDVSVPIPDAGTFGIAIGERVPFDRYPLPPRPATLGSLDQALPAGCTEALCPDAVIIRSNPDDPMRSVRRTLTWRPLDSIGMVAQTPGLLHLRVNGVEVMTGEWWDYAMSGNGMYGDKDAAWKREFGLDLRPGESVTIEIVPEHFTGSWQVVFVPDGLRKSG